MDFISNYCSSDTSELSKAMLAVQKDLRPVVKDAKNEFCKNKYVTLTNVLQATMPILQHHGIWLSQYTVPSPEPGCMALVTKLVHVASSQWTASMTIVPMPKNDPQGMGSATTYARRYAITTFLALETIDDDGEAAKLQPRQPISARRTAAPMTDDPFPAPGNEQRTCLDNLPVLEDVQYDIVTSQEGRQCVIAKGNTHAKKEILRGCGFRWSPERKVWWKFADAA